MEQNPAAATKVNKPENPNEKISIKVVLSLGKNTVTIPDLQGKTYEEAWMELVKLGFSPNNIERKEKFSASVEPGKVVETSPLAKTSGYNVDEVIIIYVNNREETVSSTPPRVSSVPPVSSSSPTSSVSSVPEQSSVVSSRQDD